MQKYDFGKRGIQDLQQSTAVTRLLDAAKPAAFSIAALIAVGAIAFDSAVEHSAISVANETVSPPALLGNGARIGATASIESSYADWSVKNLEAHVDSIDSGLVRLKNTDDGYTLVKLSHGPMSGAAAWLDPHGVINDYHGAPAVQMPNGDRIHFKDGKPSTVGFSDILGYRRLELKSDAAFDAKEIYQQLIVSEVGGKAVVIRRSYEDSGLIAEARDEYRISRNAAKVNDVADNRHPKPRF